LGSLKVDAAQDQPLGGFERKPAHPRRACFFARVADPDVLQRVDFYRQDIECLQALGFEVTIATRWSEVPTDADLYFIWWWTWAFVPLSKSLLARRPAIVTGVFDYRWDTGLRGDYFSRPWWQRLLLRFALRAADANVFCNEVEHRDVVAGLKVTNPVLIPLTVDTDRYSPTAAPREDLVLTVALSDELNAKRKCLPEIIEAMPLILERYPAARFVIAGKKGTYLPELERRVAELGLSDRVDFPGIVSEERKIELMRCAKVYLQPTRYEGFGLAQAEAMSCGAAVVSSPAGAVPEVVGDAGILVEPVPAKLADAVVRLLQDDALRQRLGERAAARIRARYGRARRLEGLARVIGALLPVSATVGEA
jgi:glycosyltransferase involved in cell wall biosynthesis